jgi:hypothetical protein
MSQKIDADHALDQPYFVHTAWQLAVQSMVATANRVQLSPVYFLRPASILKISVYCSNLSAGQNCRIGLYGDMGGTPVGGRLLFETGNISVAAVGTKTGTPAPPISVGQGLKAWLALATSDNVQNFFRQSSQPFLDSAGVQVLDGCYYALGGWGVLDNPCPAVTADGNARVCACLKVL